MYVPQPFRNADNARLHDFVEAHSFGLLVTSHAGLTASHLPLLLERNSGQHGVLVGHMARANPQWQNADGQPALAVFKGPHAYISPTWYHSENVVPTWNYVSVHVSGTLRLIDDIHCLREIVERTVDRYESRQPTPWRLQPDAEYWHKLLPQIVGFHLEIEQIQGKWKLSQNHSVDRRGQVIEALQTAEGHEARDIARLMQATLSEPQP